jgi:hypothetical protein
VNEARLEEAMARLTPEEEVKDLRAWKESAIVQFRKANKLMEYVKERGNYLGWDLYDAAIDLLQKDCPCCGYPHCGHTHTS